MSESDHPLSHAEFTSIYGRVPRLTVEIIVKDVSGAVYLTKRAIQPCIGQWHLPGGTVRFGELLIEAAKRIASRELGIAVEAAQHRGFIEFPSHFKNGLDHPVGVVFEVTRYSGDISTNEESEKGGWFRRLPKDIHADHDTFLLENGYLDG